MNSLMDRRQILAGLAGVSFVALAGPAFAFSTAKAEKLITNLVADINKIINSGKSEASMLKDFDKLFGKYADVTRIAQLVLGPDGRSASAAQKKAFARAFQSYIARKYGRRFREFEGGRVEVNGARTVKSYYEVTTTAHLKGEAPFVVHFVVADKNGLFIDMKIEGISLIKAERTEIGAMLDRRKGNIDQLTKDLKTLG
ncbi:MAG: MlaC/ttg2D family ABC transporter substrate-binding protein [Paracoccaceae bacterium]